MPGAAAPLAEEFRRGWPIIVGCALGIATGVAVLFLSFSIFVVPLTRELGITRGALSTVQALVVTAAVGSPVVGWLTDRYGVHRVYAGSALLLAGVEAGAALWARSLFDLGLTIALIGLIGAGTGTVVLSRPITAHFQHRRGTALGVMAMLISVLAILAPPLINAILDVWGWRGAFLALAGGTVLIGIPAVLALVPDGGRAPPTAAAVPAAHADSAPHQGDRAYLRSRDFWLLVAALISMSLATAGAASQLAPMVEDTGLGAATAALALSCFSAGTFIGRLGGGWLLDRIEPRRAAFWLTLLPAAGFVILLIAGDFAPAILLAVTIIGIQQGAEIDIFAYLVARRFALAQYSAVYGTLVGLGWIGNVGGLLGMGKAHDLFGSYAPAQAAAVLALALAAVTLLALRLPPQPQSPAA